MSFNIISTRRFEKELKRLAKKFPSLKNEFAKLIDEISANPLREAVSLVTTATKSVWQ